MLSLRRGRSNNIREVLEEIDKIYVPNLILVVIPRT